MKNESFRTNEEILDAFKIVLPYINGFSGTDLLESNFFTYCISLLRAEYLNAASLIKTPYHYKKRKA